MEGWWKYGSKEGIGTYVFYDTKMKIYGEYVNGNIERGKWIFPNGTFYEGAFQNNQPNGQGTWFFKNGNEATGSYTQSKATDEEGEV